MKLTDDFVKQKENANTQEGVREAIEKSDLELSDDDLDQVTGGLTSEIGKFFKKVIEKVKEIVN